MLSFPLDKERKQIWVKNINRTEVVDRMLKFRDSTSKNIQFKNKQAGDVWEPSIYEKICSVHFIDGKPKDINPYPTEQMGHATVQRKRRKDPLTRSPFSGIQKNKKMKLTPRCTNSENSENCEFSLPVTPCTGHDDSTVIVKDLTCSDNTYSFPYDNQVDCSCKGCQKKDIKINFLETKVEKLEAIIDGLSKPRKMTKKGRT